MLRLLFRVSLLSCVGAVGCGDGVEPGGSGGTGGSGGAGGTIMLEPGPTCIAFCAKVVGECNTFTFDQASCEQGCEGNLADERAKSEACGDAVEAVFQCVAELDCPDVDRWVAREPADAYPCRSAVVNVGEVCP